MEENKEFTSRPLIEQQLENAGKEIEKLMDVYPCLREICMGLKTQAYPAALFAGAAFLGTLMTRCTYRYYARPEELRRLNYGVYIIGDPGTGKSFVTRLYKLLAGPIERVSKEGKNAMNRYKRKYKAWLDNGQKGEGPKKPKPLIRTHPARTSNKVFIEDMVNAVDIVDGEEMHLHQLSFDTELDNTINLQSEAWNNKTFLEMKAFHNEEDGMAFSNIESSFVTFNVYWNYVYTGTPMALRHKINSNNVQNGLSTRIAAIPMPSCHFEMMPMEKLEDAGKEPEEYETLRMWAERLDKTHGELPISRLVDECYGWTDVTMQDAEEDQSRADEVMCKRVGYYGINVSAPFIMMRHWDEWQQKGTLSIDETDLMFCQLIMDIQMDCQRYFFGRYWEVYFEHKDDILKNIDHTKRHSVKMKQRYARLPEEFTTEQAVNLLGLRQSTAEKMIGRWLREGYITMPTYAHYRKAYLDLL